MRKILIRLTLIVTAIANLSLLAFVSSCVESKSSFGTGGELTAVRRVFPSANDIAEITQGAQISGRPDETVISEIKGASGVLGYRVESKVVSRSGPFRIRVFLDKQGYVKQASVISYPWKRGRDVRKPAFTSQFEGKGLKDPIQLGKDIDAMSGATISSRVMTEGVRDTIKLIERMNEK
ncbi:MAG: FMN-binding protein [Planctomycetes bacterium]|nr:FMN-binding protein [Planctomycetota bacterium]